jgi:tetratricopeptide (TPR) repeat protein
MKRVLFVVLFAVFSLNLFAQNTWQRFDLTNYGVKIEPDKRLMVVMASLEAAGLETSLAEKGAEFRRKLQADLQDLNPELRQKLKTFVDQYKRRHAGASQAEIISPFVSMAYTLSPVPDLSDPARTTDLPGDLLEVLDFAPLVREFYRRSYAANLDGYLKDYQTAGDQMRKSSAQMVGELLEYLHTKPQLSYVERIKIDSPTSKDKKKTVQKVEIRERERRFFIVPELLVPKGTINFRNVGDDYYSIVPADTDLNRLEVRRAYLQYVIDPLVASNAKDISTFRAGIKSLLDERRKENVDISPDVYLTVSRSLAAAVEAKEIEFRKTLNATAQARNKIDSVKTVEQKKAVSAELDAFKKSLADETALQLSEAYERGAVLAFYFADQLKGFEGSGFDISSSLRDMILSLDTTKETNRLAQFADARNRALLMRNELRKNAGSNEAIITNPVTQKLLEIDKIVQAKNYADAEAQLKQLLQQNPNESRIHYALGRLASLSAEGANEMETRRHLLAAKAAYEKVISFALANKGAVKDTVKIDTELLSLSYIGVARIHEFYGETEVAIKVYEAAIKLGNTTDESYKQAVAAREKLMKEQ